MTVKKMMVILNPCAGNGKGKKALREIEQWKRLMSFEKKIEIRIEFTSKDGLNTAENLAREAVWQGYDLVVAVGGDGTGNDVINGLVLSNVPLAIVRAGTVNDLAKVLRIPRDTKEALDLAIRGSIVELDVGEVNGRFFASYFTIGIGPGIARFSSGYSEKFGFLPKILVYLLSFLREVLFDLEYPFIKMEVYRGQETELYFEGRITFLLTANNNVCGGIFKFAADADLCDGLLDVFCLSRIGLARILRAIPSGLKGTISEIPEVSRGSDGKIPKGSLISVWSVNGKGIDSQIDGEFFSCEREYTIRVIPKALKVVIPQAVKRIKEKESFERVTARLRVAI